MSIDPVAFSCNNDVMNNVELTSDNPVDEEALREADFKAVIRFMDTGVPVDPEVAQRIHERAERIRLRVFKEHGLLDIAVPSIRELRGPLPE